MHDFFEDAAGTLRIAHVHVRPRQVELGANLAHGHGFHFRQRMIVGLELGGAARRADRLQLVGRRLGAIQRLAHIEIDALAARAGLEYFRREYVVFRSRLFHGIAAAQRIGKPIQIQVDAVAAESAQAAQLGSGFDVHFPAIRDVGEFRRLEARCRTDVAARHLYGGRGLRAQHRGFDFLVIRP